MPDASRPRLALHLKLPLLMALVGALTALAVVLIRADGGHDSAHVVLAHVVRLGAMELADTRPSVLSRRLERLEQAAGLDGLELRIARRIDVDTSTVEASSLGEKLEERISLTPELSRALDAIAAGDTHATGRSRGPAGDRLWAVAPLGSSGSEFTYLQAGLPSERFAASLFRRPLSLLGALLLGGLIGLLGGLLALRSALRPVQELNLLLKSATAAGGDLSLRTAPGAPDAVGELGDTVNGFIAHLQTLARRVVDSAGAIGEFGQRIVNISDGHVSAVSEQSAAVGQTTRTIGELVTSFDGIANRSSAVSQEARSARTLAEEGSSRLNETVAEMETVKTTSVETIQEIYGLVEQSHKIGEVMNLINDVAAKTKLIAFNAAIEASAAGGEAGRRFSVVAQEVRRLAERVVKSTGEIEGIIRDIQARVEKLILKTEENYRKIERGYQAAEDARRAIHSIEHSVQSTVQVAAEISETTTAQLAAGEQVMASLKAIEQTTGEFKTTIQEMRSTAGELDRLFADLITQTRRFQLGGSEQP